jgi:hypothetical protein
MRRLRIAAGLVGLYGLVLIGNAVFYIWWSGDTSELPRLVVRLFGCVLVGHGLWNAAKWGWWLGLFFTGALALIGSVGIASALAVDLFGTRPYPTVDLTVLILGCLSLATAFLLIVSRAARTAVRENGVAG